MELSKLSWYYHHACDRIHEIIDDLYEALHNEEGVPMELTGEVEEARGRDGSSQGTSYQPRKTGKRPRSTDEPIVK